MPWLEFQHQWIVQSQQWAPALLVPFFRAITLLGNFECLLIGATCLHWWGARVLSRRILLLTCLIGALLSGFGKGLFAIPRPFVTFPDITAYVTAKGFSFPSGHAQIALILWGSLALATRKIWLQWIIILIVFLVGCSRVYLGVHYPIDIVASWIPAGLGLWLVHLSGDRIASGWSNLTTKRRCAMLGLALPPIDWLAYRYDQVTSAIVSQTIGLALGTLIGMHLARSLSSKPPPWPRRVADLFTGLAGLGLLWFAYEWIIDALPAWRIALRHLGPFCLGLWITAGPLRK